MHLTLNGCVVRDKRICIDFMTLRGITIRFKKACSSRRRRDSVFKPNRRLLHTLIY
jgi:hypothetical protein